MSWFDDVKSFIGLGGGGNESRVWGWYAAGKKSLPVAVDADGKLTVGGIDVGDITIDLDKIEAVLGIITDEMVAAGATGTVSAKIRRLTEDLGIVKTSLAALQTEGDLKSLNDLVVAITTTSTNIGALDSALVAAGAEGNVTAKLRRLTTDLGDLLGLQQSLFARQVIIAAADVDSATNTTLTFEVGTLDAYADGVLVGESLRIVGGPGNGQTRIITEQTGDTITVDREWDTNPTSASKASISRCMVTKMGEVMENPITEYTQLWRLKRIEDGQKLTTAVTTAVIANDASLSGAVEVDGAVLMAIAGPADWTVDSGGETPTEAPLTFQVSADGGSTYVELYDDDGPVEIAPGRVDAGAWLSPEMQARLLGVTHFKLRSGTAASPINQGAERTFQISFKR